MYFRLLINLLKVLAYSTLKINPLFLSSLMLYILGVKDTVFPKVSKPIKEYYCQYFNTTNSNSFRYLGYGLTILVHACSSRTG